MFLHPVLLEPSKLAPKSAIFALHTVKDAPRPKPRTVPSVMMMPTHIVTSSFVTPSVSLVTMNLVLRSVAHVTIPAKTVKEWDMINVSVVKRTPHSKQWEL